jgi:hypothetical protein
VVKAPVAGNDTIAQFPPTVAGGECFPVPAFFGASRVSTKGSKPGREETADFLDQLQRK